MLLSLLPFKKIVSIFFASKEFWFCNIIGFAFFIIVNSLRAFYYGGEFYDAFTDTIGAAFISTFTLLVFRYFYFKWQCNRFHPIKLIPAICAVSFSFSLLATTLAFPLHYYQHIGLLNFVNGLIFSPNLTPWTASAVGYFSTYIYVMQSLLMIYVFIQAERSATPVNPFRLKDILLAISSLLIMHQFLQIRSAVAYYNPPGYLFSTYYFWGSFWTIAFSLLFSLYIFLLKPREELFQSRLLPQIPMLVVLVFCSSAFSMWAFKLIPHIHHVVVNIPLYGAIDYISQLLTGSVPLWGGAGAFAGILHSKFNEQFVVAAFFLHCSFTNIWQRKNDAPPAERFDAKKSLQFWAYNIGGWSAAGLYLYFSDLLELKRAGTHLPQMFILSFVTIGSFLGAMLRSIMKQLQMIQLPLLVFTYKTIILSFIFGVLLACALTMISYTYIYGALGNDALTSKQHIFSGSNYFYNTLPWFSLCFVVWSLIYEISVSQRNKLLSELKQLYLEKNMKEVQLNTLAGKIDPHFIFNALNNIRAMIRVDAEGARDAIVMLSEILRSPIAKTSQDKISISQEMALVRNYIALSVIQLGHRLEYKEFIDSKLEAALIPSMMLQIMVENAIKHGINQLPKGGVLSLDIHRVENKVLCRITNTGTLLAESNVQGFGVGIKNIQNRLLLLYNNQASFHLQKEPNIVVAELILPLEIPL